MSQPDRDDDRLLTLANAIFKAVDALRGPLWIIVVLLAIACISLFSICTHLSDMDGWVIRR